MEFINEGVILSARAHGETHAVAEIFTRDHGRWAGLVYGGQGRKSQPLLQPGNSVRVEWKGRLAESLGHFALELLEPRAANVMHDRFSLAGLSAVCATALACLPEREAHRQTYEAMLVILDNLDQPDVWPALMARWELGLLAAVGFGPTLDRCAATGVVDNLIYVSPKSACAVSRDAGEPYKDKLLPLPGFITGASTRASQQDMIDALEMTGYFLATRILHLSNLGLPEARSTVIGLLKMRDG